jgi:UDPglucose--hexose-1-phosphate uridylyltransferase
MAKFVPDVKTQRWIVISPARQARPSEQKEKEKGNRLCPFCEGNEHLTPPEVMRIGRGEKDKAGWKIRVVPNKFPITDIHEVIIHSPDHQKDIGDFDNAHNELLLSTYRSRYQMHTSDGQVMIFCNHGEHAGASLAHPHSQLVVIPRQINLDALVREPVMNVIEDNNFFVTYCPDFSQWPYEVWIAPKKNNSTFGEIGDEELKDLAVILRRTLKKLSIKHSNSNMEMEKMHLIYPFAYNFYIHHEKNWFIRIIPRLIHRAGFELGTGLSVNVVDPVQAARELMEIRID